MPSEGANQVPGTEGAPALGDVQFELEIEQWHRWGSMKWYGNVIERTWTDILGEPQWTLGICLVGGWFAWSRKGIEKKLRRYVEKRRREIAWKATAPKREEILA